MKYDLEFYTLKKAAQGLRFIAFGWAAGADDKPAEYLLLVNGQPVHAEFKRVRRSNVCEINGLSFSAAECGFFSDTLLDGNIRSLRLIARGNNETQELLHLSDEQLKNKVSDTGIVYKTESYTKDNASKMAMVTGWAASLDHHQLSFHIIDENGNEIDSTLRLSAKHDLLRNGLIEKEELLSGFTVYFPFEQNQSYWLQIEDGSGIEKECIESFYIEPPKGRNILSRAKTIIRNVNLENVRKFYSYSRSDGLMKTIRRTLQYQGLGNIDYNKWFLRNRVTEQEIEEQKNTQFSYAPTFSFIVPTYNTKEHFFREMADTVLAQTYPNWELCIADGSDEDHPCRQLIKEYAAKDSRIKYTFLNENYGISGNTNKALELAGGEYTALYDHDDFVEPDALFEIVKALQEKNYDVIYTDEDKFNDRKKVYDDPNLKSDWNPDLFTSHNYITHLFVAKTDLIRRVGGLRSEYDGSQDYDLIFRCIENANGVLHIPKILYHWRMHVSSTAGNPESKMYCYYAGQKAIQSHFDRTGIEATVELAPKPYYGCYKTTYATTGNPLVSVIIPNCENKDVLETCVNSLLNVNTYANIEILIVENNSRSDEIFSYYQKLESEHENIHVIRWDQEGFNYSAINNFGAAHAKGEYLLLLNNDTEVISPDAISRMLGVCMREDVGIVGAKLLYADNTVQHAGVVIGFEGYAGHVFNGTDEDSSGFMMRAKLNCDYSAVTAACLMTKKSIYTQVDGLDETFRVAANDVDYCLKVRQTGHLVVYCADALFHHFESKTRGYENTFEKRKRFDDEVRHFQEKWMNYLIEGDPYYNPNFEVEYGPYILR